ncbi:MAG: hypothetical protein IKP76_04700 [Bacilli bacterium]|nr:hypothetical protein [Bacilli bacterium]
MTKIDVIPTLENEIAIIEARNTEDGLIDQYRVERSRRVMNLAFLIVPLALLYVGTRYNVDAVEVIGSCTLAGFAGSYILRAINSTNELHSAIKNINKEEYINSLKRYDKCFLKNENQTKLRISKNKKELSNMKKIELDNHENLSKLDIKKIIKRNEKEYYRHYNLPEYNISNAEFNAIVDSLYIYLEEYYPDVNKEEYILKLFRLLYADSLVNYKETVNTESIQDALYYDNKLIDEDEIGDIYYLIEQNIEKNKECKIYEYKKRQ